MKARRATSLVLLASTLGLAAARAAQERHPLRPRGALLDQDLESTHVTLPSFHFRLWYPETVSEDHAQYVVEVLESELHRLRAWIPVEPGPWRLLEVHLFPAEDFEEAYGPLVIGIYDGRLRIPIVTSGEKTGILTSTLTHELVHALVARLTGFAVPLWLQEGLAQYLELDHEFPEPDRLAEIDPLPLWMIDEILIEAGDPVLVERAYRESVWAAHFIGERFGISGFRHLLRAYAEGHGDESALGEAFELSQVDFERELEEWYGQGPPERREDGNVTYEDEATWADMDEWFGYYRSRTRPVKATLRHVVAAMRGTVPFDGSCSRLLRDLAELFGDEALFDCPDEDVGFMLFEAFRHFEELARSCAAKRPDRMDGDLDSAERALRMTASLLASHGLEP